MKSEDMWTTSDDLALINWLDSAAWEKIFIAFLLLKKKAKSNLEWKTIFRGSSIWNSFYFWNI
jgi:hypothetical protein